VSPSPEDEPRAGETEFLGSLSQASRSGVSASTSTVWIAFCANLLVGVAKSIAAVLTGSASMLAEAAHSWADAGNEVFLLVANRRSHRPPDRAHPLGHGREAYVWSLLAALGLFVAGAAVSVTHGIQELITPEPATDFVVGYVVLALSFVVIRQLRQTPKVEAAALLQKAVIASESRPAAHKRLRITTRTGQMTRVIGVAHKPAARESEIARLFDAAHYDWDDPLSAKSYSAWRGQLPSFRDAIASEPNSYEIKTTTEDNELLTAKLKLRSSDLEPIEGRFEFRNLLNRVDELNAAVPAAAPLKGSNDNRIDATVKTEKPKL